MLHQHQLKEQHRELQIRRGMEPGWSVRKGLHRGLNTVNDVISSQLASMLLNFVIAKFFGGGSSPGPAPAPYMPPGEGIVFDGPIK